MAFPEPHHSSLTPSFHVKRHPTPVTSGVSSFHPRGRTALAFMIVMAALALNGILPAVVSAAADGPDAPPSPNPHPTAALQVGHGAMVKGLAFSPDGKSLVSGGLDRTGIIWDVPTGRVRAVLRGHHDWIMAVAFSPDNSTVATGGFDGVNLWNASTGALVGSLEPFAGVIQALAFSPDGRTIVCGREGATPELWNVATRHAIKALKGPTAGIQSLAVTPNGMALAVGQSDGTIRLWSLVTGEPKAEMPGHTGPVHSVTFNQDASLLASCGEDGTARLWDTATRTTRFTLKPGDSPIWGAVFAAGGDVLVTVGSDAVPHLWDATTGKDLLPLKWWDHEPMQSVAISADGATLATGGGQPGHPGVIRLWEMKSRTVRAAFHGKNDVVTCADFSPDGATLATGSGVDLKLWDTKTWKLRSRLEGDSAWVQNLAFSPDGKTIAFAGWGGSVPLYDTATGQLKAKLQQLHGCNTLAFSPDGGLVAAASGDTEVRLFNSQGVFQKSFNVPQGPVQLLAISPDNKKIAISSKALHQSWIADIPTGTVGPTIAVLTASMLSFAFSPDSQTLATGGWDSTVKLWAVDTGQLKASLPLNSGVRAIAFSADGKRLAAGETGGPVSVWNLAAPTPTLLSGVEPGPDFPASVTHPLMLAGGGIALLSHKGGPPAAMLLPMPRPDPAPGAVPPKDAAQARNASWFVTTPDGYFDCSPDALGQILWNEDGRLFPEEKYDAQFHRPDLVEKALQDAQ